MSGSGSEFTSGLFYTGLTRVRRLQDIAFVPQIPSLTNLNSKKSNTERSEEDRRKARLAEALKERLTSGVEPTGNFV